MPKVSVIMPAYNAEKYIKEAIDSILGQTFRDFELIVLNDCSRDHTESVIRSYDDPRIVYVRNEQNMGVARTLNRGLELAKGEYIARMDADDIALPERFAVQLDYLERNPDTAVVASAVELFGAQDGVRVFSATSEKLKADLLYANCFAHPSVMMRTAMIRELGGYDGSFEGVEDYHLWVCAVQKYRIASVEQVLLRYRIHPSQVTQTQSVPKRDANIQRLKRMMLEPLELEDEEGFQAFCNPRTDIKAYQRFAKALKKKNREKKIFDPDYLRDTLREVNFRELDRFPFFRACMITSQPFRYAARRLLMRVILELRKPGERNQKQEVLKHKDFSILSNNCWGGSVYQRYGLPYLSPTAGLYFLGDDFVKFCRDWRGYTQSRLEFIPWETARYYPQLKDEQPYPVAKLKDIEVYFMHYRTAEEAEDKWKRRVARINPDRLIFKLSQRECCSKEDLEAFLRLPLPNKLCFGYEKVDGAILVPELENLKGDEQFCIKSYFDELEYLNSLD